VAYNANILLGRIIKIQGYNGTLTVKLENDFTENIPEMESVFIEIDGKPVPFFISSSDYSGGDSLKLRFEGYGTYEKVSGFSGCRLFLTSGDVKNIPSGDGKSISGFKVILKNKTVIGNIDEIIHNPGQNLLKVISPEKKEILIPFHRDFILSLDEKKRIIIVELPEGLTEIN
jgi:16S rRNA processing protein RimM